MKEIWREIENYPLYDVSNLGRVRSWNKSGWGRRDEPVLLSLLDAYGGYRQVTLRNDDGGRQVLVHVLVLEAFVGLRPDGMEVRHLDGDPSNDNVDNLCWGTHKENMEDMVRHGTSNKGRNIESGHKGGDNWSAVKVPDEIISEIRERHGKGESYLSIAKDFDVSWGTIRTIDRGEHWSQREDQE